MGLLSREDCLRILEDAGVGDNVLKHVLLVESLALAIAREIERAHPGSVDLELIAAGALLHDLGRARTHGVEHATVGVEMAERLGLDARIVEIIRRHVGAGLLPQEARALGLPSWDGMPRTLEEKIVCHADTLCGERSRRTLARTVEEIRRHDAREWERRAVALHRELGALAGKDIDDVGPSSE